METVDERRAAFRALHDTGCFVIPNPWDVGSAVILRHLGFKALATTSAGMQFSRGQADALWTTSVEDVLSHVADIVAATELPVNADFQGGYADDPDAVATNVSACVATGVAGLSIEDATGDPDGPLYDLPLAIRRIEAARGAIDAADAAVLLTARAESYLVRHPEPLSDVLRRLSAYAAAGADVLYAPGPTRPDELGAIVREVAPKPVNALVMPGSGLTFADLAAVGVRRISVGSALARAAIGAFMRAATAIVEDGTFDLLDDAAPFAELNGIFSSHVPRLTSHVSRPTSQVTSPKVPSPMRPET